MKTTMAILALCLSASAAYAQDKKKPGPDEDPVLKEVDKRLKSQGEDLLRAFGRMLDERLGKPAEKKDEPRKKEPEAKKPDEKKGDDRTALLKEVDRRLKAQREEILRAVERMLDQRLGRGPRPYAEQAGPGKKGPPMRAEHLPPGLAKKKHGRDEDGKGKKKPGKGEEDDD